MGEGRFLRILFRIIYFLTWIHFSDLVFAKIKEQMAFFIDLNL